MYMYMYDAQPFFKMLKKSVSIFCRNFIMMFLFNYLPFKIYSLGHNKKNLDSHPIFFYIGREQTLFYIFPTIELTLVLKNRCCCNHHLHFFVCVLGDQIQHKHIIKGLSKCTYFFCYTLPVSINLEHYFKEIAVKNYDL